VRRLFLFVIVVAGLLAAADRVAAWAAGQLVADRLARAYQLDRAPQVQVQGIPFLTQWSSGRYQEVDVQLPDVTTNRVTVTNLSAQLHTVTTTGFATSSADLAGATIGQVDVQGVVPYASIPLPPGFQATPQGSQLRLSGSISAAGVSVPLTATVSVSVQNGVLQLTADQVNVPGAFSRLGLAAVLNQELSAARTALQLPVGARLDAVSVTPSGLQISASATQVQMPR
jgi:hypothetical protein